MVAGRDVARSGRSDRKRTADIFCALLCMRGTFPIAEQDRRFDGMMKFFLSRDNGTAQKSPARRDTAPALPDSFLSFSLTPHVFHHARTALSISSPYI